MLPSRPTSPDTTNHHDYRPGVALRLKSFQEALALTAQKNYKAHKINKAVYNTLIQLSSEAIDLQNTNAQYHHILKSCHLVLQAIPRRNTFSANTAYSDIHDLITEEVYKCAWCDSFQCPHQQALFTTNTMLDDDDDANIIALLKNLNAHSYITPHTIKDLTLSECSTLLGKVETLINLLDHDAKTRMDALVSNGRELIQTSKQILNPAEIYTQIIVGILQTLHHMSDVKHAYARELAYELLFWEMRRFEECSMLKENPDDSTSALTEACLSLLTFRLSEAPPVSDELKTIVEMSREAISVDMNPHKFGAQTENHPDLINRLQLPDNNIAGTIKKILVSDFIAYFANPESPYAETDHKLRDLFYDPYVLNGNVREKRKDAYYQLTKLGTFSDIEDPKRLLERLMPLMELKGPEDFQALQAYLAIYPCETSFHGIDIPSDLNLLIICEQIKRYKNLFGDLNSSHFKWFIKHLHDFISSDDTAEHMLDYILNCPPVSDKTKIKKLEDDQVGELEFPSNHNNQDQEVSSPRLPHDKGELSSDEKKSPVQTEQENLLRRSVGLSSPGAGRRPLSNNMPSSAVLAGLNLRPTWSSYSRTKKILIVTAVAAVLALALAGLAAALLYAGPVVPMVTVAGAIVAVNWATAIGTAGVVGILAGLPVFGAVVGLLTGFFLSRKSYEPASVKTIPASPRPIISSDTRAQNNEFPSRRRHSNPTFFAGKTNKDEGDMIPYQSRSAHEF